MPNLAICIRGHERRATEDNEFRVLLEKIVDRYKADIFLHTWDFSEASNSWRNLPPDKKNITKDYLKDYFKNLDIKKIFVDNDENIEIFGRITGRLGLLSEITLSTSDVRSLLEKELSREDYLWARMFFLNEKMFLKSDITKKEKHYIQYAAPILPWKKMWFGIYKIIDYAKSINKYDLILNTRFDILCYKKYYNPGSPLVNFEIVCNLIDNYQSYFNFLNNRFPTSCCDNIYVGNTECMYNLCKEFHFDLDLILKLYNHKDWNGIQEHLVFLEAQRIKNCFLEAERRKKSFL